MLKWMLRPEVFEVINKSGGTRGNEYETEDSDGKRPFADKLTVILY